MTKTENLIKEQMTAARRSSYLVTEEGEVAHSILFYDEDGRMWSSTYRDLHHAKCLGQSLVIEFEKGYISVAGRGLEKIMWLLVENRLISLSASSQANSSGGDEPIIEKISYSSIEEIAGKGEVEEAGS